MRYTTVSSPIFPNRSVASLSLKSPQNNSARHTIYVKKNAAVLAVAVFLILLTVLSSFADYEISQKLYLGQMPSDNFFGVLFAFIGILPTFVGWSFLGASITYLCRYRVQDKSKRRLLYVFSTLLFCFLFSIFATRCFL